MPKNRQAAYQPKTNEDWQALEFHIDQVFTHRSDQWTNTNQPSMYPSDT